MGEIENSSFMQILMIVILLLCGYLWLLQYVYQHAANRSNLPVLAIFLLLIYGGVSGMLMMILSRMGNMEVVFVSTLILAACVTVFMMLTFVIRRFREIQKRWLSIFIVYLLALAYVTVFSRDGVSNDTSIFAGFTSVQKFIETGDVGVFRHLMLNLAMFVPVGVLLPMIQPERLNKLMVVAPISAMMTVMIESVQLLLRLGQCDLEDITANALGGVVGLLLYRIGLRFLKATPHNSPSASSGKSAS